MANLMTVAEVITAAFTRKVDAAQIKDADIAIAEWEYIRPILTEGLYNDVVITPSIYVTLITDYIKPCLAYYVKYLVFNDFMVEVSDRGINQLVSTNANPVSSQLRTDAKLDVLARANILENKLKNYINERYYAGDSIYSEYGNTANIHVEKKLIGGFLCDDDSTPTSDGTIESSISIATRAANTVKQFTITLGDISNGYLTVPDISLALETTVIVRGGAIQDNEAYTLNSPARNKVAFTQTMIEGEIIKIYNV